MINRLILAFICSIILSGCATVNRGATDHFRIDTVPQGATVTTSIPKDKGARKAEMSKSDYIGCWPTPCAIALPRRSEFVATLEHPGYEPTNIFIRSSKLKGGSTASAAANLASASGSGFAIAGMVATMDALFTTLFSLGSQTVNTSGIATTGATAGLGIGVGMIAVDMASGANLNLFPNPVVIELAPSGTAVREDPLVGLYWKMNEADSLQQTICKTRKKNRDKNALSCQEARSEFNQSRANFQALKRKQLEDLKASIEQAKKQQKAALTK